MAQCTSSMPQCASILRRKCCTTSMVEFCSTCCGNCGRTTRHKAGNERGVRMNHPAPLRCVATDFFFVLRLTLPAAAVERLRKSGIYCSPNITVEYQQATKRHVLRGRESGGGTRQFGHYVTFCGEGGERLPWFVRPDSLTNNGDHAIVLAPALVSVEALRVEHTYELLIARHELRAEKEGARPRIWSRER